MKAIYNKVSLALTRGHRLFSAPYVRVANVIECDALSDAGMLSNTIRHMENVCVATVGGARTREGRSNRNKQTESTIPHGCNGNGDPGRAGIRRVCPRQAASGITRLVPSFLQYPTFVPLSSSSRAKLRDSVPRASKTCCCIQHDDGWPVAPQQRVWKRSCHCSSYLCFYIPQGHLQPEFQSCFYAHVGRTGRMDRDETSKDLQRRERG